MAETRGLRFALLTAFVSGFSIFLNKYGVSGIDSSVFTFAKNAAVALLLYSFIALAGETPSLKRLSRRGFLMLAAIGLIGGSIPFLLFFKGLSLTSAAKAAFIHKTMFVYVMALAYVFLREKINFKTASAAGVLLAGNALILDIVPTNLAYGDYLILAATILWAAENTLSKHVLKDLPSRVVAFGRMFFGSAFILAYLILAGKATLMFSLSLPQLAWVLASSGFLFLYVSFWYEGLKHLSVSTATTVLLLGSPVTTLLSLAFSGASISYSTTLGILLTLVGVYAMTEASSKTELPTLSRKCAPTA
jgi:drug/metabolite transporter (DMT)-like permease